MLTIGHSLHASDPNVRQAMASGDRAWLLSLARRQKLAGVELLDLNASAFEQREVEILAWCAQLVETLLDEAVMLDSADPRCLLEVAASCRRAPWLNSFELSTPWPDGLEAQLARGSQWIVQLRDASRIPEDAAQRMELCERALERVRERHLPWPWIDAVALPWGGELDRGRGLLEFLEEARRRWPRLRCLVGLSNLSYGSARRAEVHRLWLPELRARGLAGALLDAFDPALLALAR